MHQKRGAREHEELAANATRRFFTQDFLYAFTTFEKDATMNDESSVSTFTTFTTFAKDATMNPTTTRC